jgi:hypothetical protein
MGALRSAGVDVPEVLGRDEQGRQVLELVPGALALDLEPLAVDDPALVGGIVRAIHDASEGFVPTAGQGTSGKQRFHGPRVQRV